MNSKWIYRLVVLLFFIALISLFYGLRSVTIPIFIAAFLAYLLDPLIDRMESKKIERGRAVLLLIFIVSAIFIAALMIVVPAIESEIRRIAGRFPDYMARFKGDTLPWIESLIGKLLPGSGISMDSLIREGEDLVKSLPMDIWKATFKAVSETFKGTLSLIISVVGTLIIPLYLFYLLRDFDKLKDNLLDLIPERNREYWNLKLGEINETISTFIRGQLIICLILALLYSTGLLIIGNDLAIVTGMISGVLFIIPYVGTIAGLLMASTLAYLKFHDLSHIIYVFILYGGVQALEGVLITPKVIGDKMGLHPLVIIIAIITGGELLGFMGMLIAVPAAATLKIFVLSALENYRDSEWYKAGQA